MNKLIRLIIVIIGFSNYTFAQTSGTAYSVNNSILVQYTIVGLTSGTSCTETLKDELGNTVANHSGTGAATTRTYQFTSLSSSTIYTVSVDCGQPYDVITNNIISTTNGAGGSLTVEFQLSSSPQYSNMSRATVNYGSTTAMGTTNQNTSCSSGCIISPSIAQGFIYYELQRQDSSNNILALNRQGFLAVGDQNRVSLISSTNGAEPSIPSESTWESNMQSAGTNICNSLASLSGDPLLGQTYYDGMEVINNIGIHKNNPSAWATCLGYEKAGYRDYYVIPNGGALPGYWKFTHGLLHTFQDDGQLNSMRGVTSIATTGAYCGSDYVNATTPYRGREAAYCARAVMDGMKVGLFQDTKLSNLITILENDIDSWIDPVNPWRLPSGDPNGTGCNNKIYLQPFMVALITYSLIQYYDEVSQDATVKTKILAALDWLYTNSWVSSGQAMFYQACKDNVGDPWLYGGTPVASPDLALFIAPAYAWAYKQTCTTGYRDKADAMFASGVAGGYLSDGKHLDQQYLYSIPIYWSIRGPKEFKQQNGFNILLETNDKLLREASCP